MEVRYFQLLAVDVHEDVKSRYLRQVTEAAEEERAQFELREKVVVLIIISHSTNSKIQSR